MGQTTSYNLPYPESTDVANVPADIRLLAEATEQAINTFSKSIDANGWIVLDYGKYKEYVRRIKIIKTISGSSWNAEYISNLPQGLSTLGNRILTFSCKSSDNAISLNIGADTSDTGITMSYRNHFSGSATTTITIDLRILEFE